MKFESIVLILGFSIIGFILYLMINFDNQVKERVNWCEDAGGIPLKGDKGHFKICLDPNAVIEKKQQ